VAGRFETAMREILIDSRPAYLDLQIEAGL
jgi:hypothetical protein